VGKRIGIHFFPFCFGLLHKRPLLWPGNEVSGMGKRNWNATAAVVVPYDFITFQNMMSETAVKSLI
jgi:hypothetical protein